MVFAKRSRPAVRPELSLIAQSLRGRRRATRYLMPWLVAALVLSGASIANAGGTGMAVDSTIPASVTCAGPSAAQAAVLSNAKSLGLKAQRAIYDQSRIGCVPLDA